MNETKRPILLSISCVIFHPGEGELAQLLGSLQDALSVFDSGFDCTEIQVSLINNGKSSDLQLVNSIVSGLVDRTLFFNLVLLDGHGNVGYGAGHNMAIRKATSDYHLILNPDVEIDSRALLEGITYLDDHENVALVVPYCFNDDGSTQYISKRYPNVFVLLLRALNISVLNNWFSTKLEHYEARDIVDSQQVSGVDIASGCFMLGRTSVLQKMDGFDEDFFMYFEDFDLSRRISEAGYQMIHLPGMKIIHAGGNTARKGLQHIGYFLSSAVRFFNKHGWRWLG